MDKVRPFGVVTEFGKFVRQDVLDSYASKSGSDVSRRLPVDAFVEHYGSAGLVPPLYNPEALARTLELNTYHYRACRTKARDTVGTGWELSAVVDEPDEAQRVLVSSFFEDLSLPLGSMLERVMMDFEAVGFAAMELVREGYRHDGAPVLLTHIPSHTLRVHQDGNKFCQIRGLRRRWFKAAGYMMDVDKDTGVERELGQMSERQRGSEVIWLVDYTPRSDFYGLPCIIPALGAMQGDIARRNYNISFFDNFGVPAYAVFITGDFDPGEVDAAGHSELEKMITKHFAQLAERPHSTLILTIPTDRGSVDKPNVDVQIKPLAVDTKEASFRLFRKDNRDEVLAAHGVPPYRMGITETGSLGGSTAVEATEIYKASILKPRQDILAQAINKWVLGGLGASNYWWELKTIDTRDEKHDLEMIKGLFAMGAISPNGVARFFADRFGLYEGEHAGLDARYVANRDVTVEPDTGMVLSSLKELRDKFIEISAKGGG